MGVAAQLEILFEQIPIVAVMLADELFVSFYLISMYFFNFLNLWPVCVCVPNFLDLLMKARLQLYNIRFSTIKKLYY